MRLSASTSPRELRERLGSGDAETLRTSEKRRRYLQKYVRLLTPARPTVELAAEMRTAATLFSGPQPDIAVTTRAFDQPITDFRRRIFDLAVQEALVVHEVGHIRYTDIDGFHELLAETDPDRRRLFARIWNTLEDGAIERNLRHRYAVATELDVLNANLFGTDSLGRDAPADGSRRFSFFHAVLAGLADMAVYDSGRFRQLRSPEATDIRMATLRDRRALDEFLPTMRETVQTVLAEPDPAARNDRIWTFWTALCDALDETAVSGAGASELRRLIDADGTVRTGNRQSPGARSRLTDASVLPADGAGAPVAGKPDDTAGEFGETSRSATELSRDSVTGEVARQVTSVAGSSDSRRDQDSEQGACENSDEDETGNPDPKQGEPGQPRRNRDAGEHADRAGDRVTTENGETTDTDLSESELSESLNTDTPDRDSRDQLGERLQAGHEEGERLSESAGGQGSSSHPGAGRLPGDGGTDSGDGADSGVSRRAATAGDEDAHSDPATEPDASAESIREQYADELAAESEALDEGATRLDALEGYIDALGVADTDAGLRVVTDAPDIPGPESGRWARASRDATRLARRFQSRLQEQQRDSQRSRCRRGTFDRSRLLSAARGQLTVFQQHEEGDDKQYSCIVVLDRSGSMNNGAVRAAERGALTAAVALDTVGVSVTMLDLHDSEVRLIKTRGENPREARDRVLTEQASGGTPLADALSLVRARFRDTENPFVIVVTDGQPDDGETYLAQLDAATFPVLGVYLTVPERSDRRPVESDRSYFHRLAVVEDWSSLDQRLQQLAGDVMF
ncbi:MAG: cobalamin biosynthesis protein CobT [uncultured archaeon A07HR60]|nr:MAG: cobalamin biosynthesis protein CobT [uncultured archaeon A07HR60]